MTSLRLGLRLALTPAARPRTAMLVLAAGLGAVVVLVVLAAGRDQLATATAYQTEMPRLVLAVVAAIVLPCAVLVATVSRLSASVRDRRLANLRLMGLTPTQTRLVAAAEAGDAALVGSLLGWVGFWALRPLLLGHAPAGQAWGPAFAPTALDQLLVVVAIPAVAVLASVLPARVSVRDAFAVSRHADRRPPGWWRLVPLGLGVAICLTVILTGHQDNSDVTNRRVVGLFAGVGLTAVGMLLVLPVLVRLLTRLATRLQLGAAQRIAVRRLEAQPAGVARIIAALLIGLFLATGARFVLVAFESTPQYQNAARDLERGQEATVSAKQSRAPEVATDLAQLDSVQHVVDLPALNGRHGLRAIVATCADLAHLDPGLQGCREGTPMWIDNSIPSFLKMNYPRAAGHGQVAWSAGEGRDQVKALNTPIDLPALSAGPGTQEIYDGLSPVYADAIIPPSMATDLPASTRHTLVALSGPGRDLPDRLTEAGFVVTSYPDYAEYDFVATMRSVIWTVAAVILAVGLLALAVSAIDRAVQRRKEIVGLQLLGLGRPLIRHAQWIETGLPISVGIVLAVSLGAFSGATYLTLHDTTGVPWAQTLVLGLVAFLGGLAVAAISVIASAPGLRPEEIRAE